VVTTLGLSPIHFGIILLLNLAIGLCTPPVGSALFVGCAVGKVSVEKATKGMLPFFVAMFVVLMLVTYVPAITMWLPNLVMPGV
jgi:TRAP-type C4-dicarboxylate transport system permease large subunit